MTRIKLTKKDTVHGNLILVNSQFPFSWLFDLKKLVPVTDGTPGIRMEKTAANLLLDLLEYTRCRDEIAVVSGFRTQEEQELIWKDTLKEKGLVFTKKFVAVPGCSEHETGLAVDLAEKNKPVNLVCPSFSYNGIFQVFRNAASRYGFVERYPAGKEDITGIGAEPWHFRYVGYPHSIIMENRHMVLEEYVLFLKEHTDFGNPYVYRTSGADIEISYIPVADDYPMILAIPDDAPYMISGTNEGGIILSVWGEERKNCEKDFRRS